MAGSTQVTNPPAALPRERQFAHLHLHTEYSLLDGGNRVDRLVDHVAKLGMTSCAITDHGNLFGAVAFYLGCKERGIKPILGVEAYVTPPDKPRTDRTYTGGGEGGFHLVLLAENIEGWNNLMYLCSEAYLTGFYYKPRIDRDLLSRHNTGLIAINGHLGSEIGNNLLDYHRSSDEKYWRAALESATWHKQTFGPSPEGKPRFYVEMQYHVPEQNAINPLAIRLAREIGAPLIADNDAHFLRAEDHDAHDTLVCINTAERKSTEDRMKYTKEVYVKSPDQMREMFDRYGPDGLEAINNSVDIADRCNVELAIGANHAPMVRITVPEPASLPRHDDAAFGGDLTAWYKAYCARFVLEPFDHIPTKDELTEAKAQCDTALRMLAEAGYVWRYGVPLGGPAGSGAEPGPAGAAGPPGTSALGGPAVPAGSELPRRLWDDVIDGRFKPSGFVGHNPYPEGTYGPARDLISSSRALPHFRIDGATYFVTWRAATGRTLSPEARTIVLDALRHFDGSRCEVYAACVMPDHVHWIVKPAAGCDLLELVRSVKQFTAREINRVASTRGSAWESECFDHIIRDTHDFRDVVDYTLRNPVEAKLAISPADYRWNFLSVSAAPGLLESAPAGTAGPPGTSALGGPAVPAGSGAEPGPAGTAGPPTDPLAAERRARLERELKILADKNISAYFLIVWDFVNWGRQHGIPAIARGSGVGTMVGYALGLSNACPVKYGLLFERFTDPDRSEYPDIDIDLCQNGRADVINYVRKKYGHVAQIITFGTMKARAAVRDVGRVLEFTIPEVDRIAKLIPETLNITIDEALEQEPELKKLYGSDARIQRLIDNARTLEGQARHASVHAAGVIVATRPLHEIVPLYRQSTAAENEVVTQWDGPTCEKMGLLKMDFLGLRTLSIIERCKKLIGETLSEEEIWKAVGRGTEARRHEGTKQEGKVQEATGQEELAAPDRLRASVPSCLRASPHPLDLDRLTYDDQKVFEMFRRGDTTGVFQFESGGMRRLLVEMKPDRLEDLIAANALFRPGPMDLIPDYNRRKHGEEEVPKVHEIVERYTGETYGVMVYQEQVMQIVHGLGGIKLRDAYSLIKAISKKKHDKIEKERPKFIDGANKQGLPKDAANELFELILKFAGYGFNKSHSTGYAIVAYQTAYLKTYFPNQYMAAFLTFESAASAVSDWIPYLEDCRRARFIDPLTAKVVRTGVEVRPPDVNLSQADFAVVFDEGEPRTAAHGHVRFGLKAIKGAGDKAIEAVLKEREGTEAQRHEGTKQETKEQNATRQERATPDQLRASVPSCLRASIPYTSVFDFCERVPPGVVNKATIESLVKCGAFDSIHGKTNRAAMIATIEQAVAAGQKLAADKAAGQGALFGAAPTPSAKSPAAAISLAKVTPWPESEALALEKDVLGFYVSSHPLDSWRAWSSLFATGPTSSVKESKQDARVIIPAMVQSLRTIVIKNGRSAGQKMAIATFEDTTGSVECVLFSDCYTKFGHLAEVGKAMFILGRVDFAKGEPQVVVDKLVPIEGVPLLPGRLQVFVDETRHNGGSSAAMKRLAELVRAAAPTTPPPKSATAAKLDEGPALFPLELAVGTATHVAILNAGTTRVGLKPEFVRELVGVLGDGAVRVVGGVSVEVQEKKRWEKRKSSSSNDDE
jgi:DNA polymerase III alpha subunit/REP element-mobilizing transposase RayT